MIVARAPRGSRILWAICALAFLSFLVWSVWASLANPDGSFARPVESAIGFGLFWSAPLLLALWLLVAAWPVYEADEFGLRRRGWLGVSAMRWDEIARYRLRTWGGYLTYVLYDHRGRRRVGIDFQTLAEGGEALFELLMRKLPEVLPGQEHARPELPHLRRRRRGALPEDPAERAVALRRRARNHLLVAVGTALIGLASAIFGGWLLWGQARLAREGRIVTAVVTGVDPCPAHRVWYTFATPDGQRHAGHDKVQHDQAEALHAGDPIRVRYLPRRPEVNGMLLGRDRSRRVGLGRTTLFQAALMLAMAAYLWRRRAGLLRELRALESGAAVQADDSGDRE
jgi:hypothetical protein